MAIYGIGTDLIEIERIKNSIDSVGEKFIQRIFTDLEIDYCQNQKIPYPSFAARFAAKEAVSKAIGTGIGQAIKWKDIEVYHDELKKPKIRILHTNFAHLDFHLSISHTHLYATAHVIAEFKTE